MITPKPVILPSYASPNVAPLPYAYSCHSALRDILQRALAKACSRGALGLSDAQALYVTSATASSGTVRAAIEEVLAACERAEA